MRCPRELDLELAAFRTDARGRRTYRVSYLRSGFPLASQSVDQLDRRWREDVTVTTTHFSHSPAALNRAAKQIRQRRCPSILFMPSSANALPLARIILKPLKDVARACLLGAHLPRPRALGHAGEITRQRCALDLVYKYPSRLRARVTALTKPGRTARSNILRDRRPTPVPWGLLGFPAHPHSSVCGLLPCLVRKRPTATSMLRRESSRSHLLFDLDKHRETHVCWRSRMPRRDLSLLVASRRHKCDHLGHSCSTDI